MKPIKITTENLPAIRQALLEVNGKAHSFAITEPMTVMHLATGAEKALNDKGVPKSARAGCSFRHTPAGPSASAYKYAVASTHIHIVRRGSAWYLVEARRQDVFPRGKEYSRLFLTPAAHKAVLETAMTGCSVITETSAA